MLPSRAPLAHCAPRGSGARASGQRTARAVLGCPLLRPSLRSELLLNRRRHEVHEYDVVRHAVEPEATVKLLRDPGRQLRPGFFGLRHLCRLALRSPRPTRTTPTPATAAPVVRSLRRGDAAEQRLDRSAHFLLDQVADPRQQALLSRHRVLLCRGRYTNARSPAKAVRQASQLQEKHAGRAAASDEGGAMARAVGWNLCPKERRAQRPEW